MNDLRPFQKYYCTVKSRRYEDNNERLSAIGPRLRLKRFSGIDPGSALSAGKGDTGRGSPYVALLFYVHGEHLRSCRDGQLT